MLGKILIPTDFSAASWKATMFGLELAQLNNANINILHVIPTVSRYAKSKKHQHLPEKLDEVELKMNQLSKDLVEENQVTIRNYVLPGNVAETMLKFIKEHHFDLVILGINSHGSTNQLGSHTSMIIEKCGVPVLIVPNSVESNGAIAS